MIATMSQPAPALSLPSPQQSSPKRPRLSLQTRVNATPTITSTSGVAAKTDIDPTSATAFNTLSNAYAAAIESSSPKTASLPNFTIKKPLKSSLRLVTNVNTQNPPLFPSQHTQTPGPITINYPDTPTVVHSALSPLTAHPDLQGKTPSFTFTPPQSACPLDGLATKVFPFATRPGENAAPSSPRTPRRRATTGTQSFSAPYTHPRTLHSILRNSPLPPRSSLTPMSPSRASQRLADRAAKKLCFNNPLTQTITNQRYIKSHIDLLAEEASPYSATDPEAATFGTLDLTMAYDGDETRDGGQTPGPFEEMRRRMAGLGAENNAEAPKTKKRKRREKKRQWVWTIGTNEDGGDEGDQSPPNAIENEPQTAADQTAQTASTLEHVEVDEKPLAIPYQLLERNDQPAPLALLDASELLGLLDHSETSELVRPNSMYLQSEGTKSPMVAFQPTSLFSIQIPTIQINFRGDVEMIDRPGTSHSI